MAADFTIKAHDTYPPLSFTISDLGGALDVSGASLISFIAKGPSYLLIGTCVMTDAANGEGYYQWQPGDTAEPGEYLFEFQMLSASGVETFPNDGYKTLSIVADLDNAPI